MVDLEPRRLSLLVTLDRLGTVTAVAGELHLTPTAVSQQLKVLEREAGTALLTRVGRRVELTDAGRALAAAARELEVARARVAATWDAFRHRVAGTVTLSVYPTGGQALLPGLLHRLAVHPDLHLEVSEADMVGDDYLERTDHVDVVLGHRASTDDSWATAVDGARRGGRDVVLTELAAEPLDVAAVPSHPVAALSEVSVADVAEDHWISVPVGWPFDRALAAWFATAGRTPRVEHRFTDLRLTEALVAGGHGIALLPRQMVDHHERLVRRPVRGSTGADHQQGPVRRVAALSRRDRAARVAVATVIAALRAEAATVPGYVSPERQPD